MYRSLLLTLPSRSICEKHNSVPPLPSPSLSLSSSPRILVQRTESETVEHSQDTTTLINDLGATGELTSIEVGRRIDTRSVQSNPRKRTLSRSIDIGLKYPIDPLAP